ncbi:MAG: T9SS type A sorting domain-containing protein [Cyclobacteriaceae bacterium]
MSFFKVYTSIIGVILASMAFTASFAQTTITSTQDGAWTTGTTWSGGTAPGTGSLTNNVVIANSVTLGSNISLSGSSSLTITVNSGGTLTISSTSFTLTGGGSSKTISIIVQSGGTLKFTGTGTFKFTGYGYLTVNSGGVVNASGTTDFINNGFLTVQSGATSVTFGTLLVDSASGTNTVTINSGGSVSASSVTLGNYSNAKLNNAGTLSVTGDFDTNGAVTNSGSMTVGGNFTVENTGSANITNSGTLSITGSFDTYPAFSNSGTMTVGGNFTKENSGGTGTSSGNITVSGNVYAYGSIQLNPGSSANSEMIVVGSVTINSNENISVGTGSTCVSSTYYADLVVESNVYLTGSGDIKVYSNGRLVVYGDIDGSTSTGTLVTVNCGGQAYVNGKINLVNGGGDNVTNNNSSSSPTGSDGSAIIGLYVNGTITAQNTTGTVGTKSQLQSNDQTFYNYIATLPNNPLPIVLEYFGIDKIGTDDISLKWITASEKNFDHFEIERSNDGTNFYEIGQVKGNGTTNRAHQYGFTDINPFSGKNYYRLRSVDFDGFTQTFGHIEADFYSQKKVAVYPNPVTDQRVNIELNFEPGSSTQVTILDQYGVSKGSVSFEGPSTEIRLELAAGIYFIKVANAGIRYESKILVK